MEKISYIERNGYGAYVIHGDIGSRQYYGYSKKDAIRAYNAEAGQSRKKREIAFINNRYNPDDPGFDEYDYI